jgi:hypothetical protein
VDGLTWRDYEADLERNLDDLHERVQRGAYRALPSRRRYIPKADGRQRPSRSLPSKTGLSRELRSRSSTRSTRRTSSGSRTGSDQSAASTMRWTRSSSGSRARR